MKSQLSGFEVSFVVKEFQDIVGGRVDKIFHTKKNEMFFRFYSNRVGKSFIRISLPSLIFLSEKKPQIEREPAAFCMTLRKYLSGLKFEAVEQIEMERLVKITFSSVSDNFFLYVELFSKGNIVLCNSQNIILSSIFRLSQDDREIKPREEYKLPNLRKSFLSLSLEEFSDIIKESEKKIVKCLAIEFGMGGVLAEELCILAEIEKTNPAKDLTLEVIQKIYQILHKLVKKEIKPRIIKKEEEIIDIVPFEFEFYKDFEFEEFESYNSALDSGFTDFEVDEKPILNKQLENKIKKLERIIEVQGQSILKYEEDIKRNEKIIEKIYENYAAVQTLIDSIKDLSNKKSWADVKKEIESLKFVKSLNLEKKEIIIDI
jgi:predicted ribosome quality control (RQC) complex YloA/Tae2 family protein